jgi:putative transcriptional regulator
MSENDIIKVRRHPDGTVVQLLPDGHTQPLADETDWTRLQFMIEEEIEANAQADLDNPPLTDSELARFRRAPNPKEIRQRLHMTQEQFATRFQLPLGTLRDWEQGVREPDSAAKSYLKAIFV